MKNNRLIVFITILIGLFIVFLFFFLKPYNYELKYQIDELKIIEKYNKKDKFYYYLIEFGEYKMPYLIKTKYTHKRKLIKEIKIFKSDTEICILPNSQYIDFYPLCTNEDEVYTYNLSEIKNVTYKYQEVKNVDKEYENLKINFLNDNSFLLFNYKGFYLINDKIEKNVKLFEKDIYKLDLVEQRDQYLIIPDYNSNYYFNKFYIIDIRNSKVKELKSKNDIYYDGYFLGIYKNNFYYVDKKEKKEYRIDIKNNKVDEIQYVTIMNNKLIKCEYDELNKIEKKELYNYNIKNNLLYLDIDDIKIKISNKEVNTIIKIDNDTVYYLSNGTLYMYNNIYGEVALITNFEWNFNNTNMIYFYK